MEVSNYAAGVREEDRRRAAQRTEDMYQRKLYGWQGNSTETTIHTYDFEVGFGREEL